MSEQDPEAAVPEPRGSLFDGPRVSDREPAGPTPPPVAPRRRGGTPLPLTLLLTAGLAGAGYYGWSHPMAAPPADQDAQLGAQVQAVVARVEALEKHAPELGEAATAQAKKLDELASRVETLAGKQDQMQAEAAKAVEIAGQKSPAADAAAPPDRTSAEVPGLIAQQQASDAAKPGHAGGTDTALADQKTALAALDQRVAKLEAAPPAPAPDTAAPTAAPATVAALAALGDRLAKLEQATGQVQAQGEAAQRAAQGDTASLAALTDRLGRLEQAAGQIQGQDAAVQKTEASDASTLAALAERVGKLEQGAGVATGAAQDATRAIRIEAAAAALQAGQPLGTLPDAPPALARYATTAPPTEAALRADFPRVAAAARAASQPDTARQSFLNRAFTRLQQSVVVRQGDHVVVGDPAAGVLARAQDSVSAGDLKGAADTLATLTGPAADAVRPWTGQVHALLDARAALATLAAQH